MKYFCVEWSDESWADGNRLHAALKINLLLLCGKRYDVHAVRFERISQNMQSNDVNENLNPSCDDFVEVSHQFLLISKL